LLITLSSLAPPSLAKFDVFRKLPAIYKAPYESQGFMTIFVAFLALTAHLAGRRLLHPLVGEILALLVELGLGGARVHLR